jgi:hypothetical protein
MICFVEVAEDPAPYRVAAGVGLDEPDVAIGRAEGLSGAGGDVTAVSGLLSRVAQVVDRPPYVRWKVTWAGRGAERSRAARQRTVVTRPDFV